ncbi:TetR/AcrR family transcriptional regulator [Paraburkholderia megapolitana]|nr:TetR/AcrR family transcriptional regulator [Paraburkholderia megapolitana]
MWQLTFERTQGNVNAKARSTRTRAAVSAVPEKRRRQSPDERRAQIIRESINFFSEHGFSGSTHDLAKQIGVTQPLMFRYFESKDDLVDAVFDAVFTQRWDSQWPKLIRDRSLSLRERLVQFYNSYLKVVFNRDWMRLYVFAGLSGVEINRRYFRILEQRILMPLCEELRAEYRMVSGLEIPITEDELDFVWSFHGGIFYHGIRRCAFGTSTDHELSQNVLDVTIDAFIDAAPHAIARFTAEARRP